MVSESDIIGAIGHEHPNLAVDNFTPTSPKSPDYNCIAWAANDDSFSWWPGIAYWPISRTDETIENFKEAFKTFGYKLGKGIGTPRKLERLAFYCIDDAPKHAARQLETGDWTSKLGPMWDISHNIEALEDGVYGKVKFYMHRTRQSLKKNK